MIKKHWTDNMKLWEDFANVIIIKAADDYRKTNDEMELEEIEKFFTSAWFGVLSRADGEKILKKLKEEKNDGYKRVS